MTTSSNEPPSSGETPRGDPDRDPHQDAPTDTHQDTDQHAPEHGIEEHLDADEGDPDLDAYPG